MHILLIHAFFAVAEGALLMYVAKDAEREAVASLTLSNNVHDILINKGEFNLEIDLDEGNPRLSEFNQLIKAFSTFVKHTRSISLSVSQLALEVDKLTKEMSNASDENTVQIEMIATATEEMTVTNGDVAGRANEVNGLSTGANQRTHKAKDIIILSGNDIGQLHTELEDTSSMVDELANKCSQIEIVMNSIKAISEQTNLLALNAAIESARAGEHGRGFAVVADEVRKLAMKTKENADEISGITAILIEDASKSVRQMNSCLTKAQEAVKSSDDACEIIDLVTTDIDGVSNNIASVATAIEQQSVASNDISKSTQSLFSTSEKLKTFSNITHDKFADLKKNIDKLTIELSKFKVA